MNTSDYSSRDYSFNLYKLAYKVEGFWVRGENEKHCELNHMISGFSFATFLMWVCSAVLISQLILVGNTKKKSKIKNQKNLR